jgi:hypothetical protein
MCDTTLKSRGQEWFNFHEERPKGKHEPVADLRRAARWALEAGLTGGEAPRELQIISKRIGKYFGPFTNHDWDTKGSPSSCRDLNLGSNSSNRIRISIFARC